MSSGNGEVDPRGFGLPVETPTLLCRGVVGAALLVVVLLAEGALRAGYDPTYHAGSAVSRGDRGWIQVANFVATGVLVTGLAVGIRRTLGSGVGPVLLGLFGRARPGPLESQPLHGRPPPLVRLHTVAVPTGDARERARHRRAPRAGRGLPGARLTARGQRGSVFIRSKKYLASPVS
jgi:Protein of unknown function (DUF998)